MKRWSGACIPQNFCRLKKRRRRRTNHSLPLLFSDGMGPPVRRNKKTHELEVFIVPHNSQKKTKETGFFGAYIFLTF